MYARESLTEASPASVVDAARAFLHKVEEITPLLNDATQMATIHGFRWPPEVNWVAERDALAAALATDTEPKS